MFANVARSRLLPMSVPFRYFGAAAAFQVSAWLLLLAAGEEILSFEIGLGPIFAARIADWEPHLRRMVAFWSAVALMTGRYHGQPMEKHLPLPVDAQHFDRWLALFEATAAEACPPAAAAHFIERARRIAQSLELGIASSHGVLLPPGGRYRGAA